MARSEAPASAKAAGNGYPLRLPPPRQSSTLLSINLPTMTPRCRILVKYAEWTALSAVKRGPIRDGKTVHQLLDEVAFAKVLSDETKIRQRPDARRLRAGRWELPTTGVTVTSVGGETSTTSSCSRYPWGSVVAWRSRHIEDTRSSSTVIALV